MRPEKEAGFKAFAIFVYLAFLGILVYLLMLNPGLDIETDISDTDGVIIIELKNDNKLTNHIIRDAKLSFIDTSDEKQLIGEVAELMPGESKKFSWKIPDYMLGEILLVAEAPYHGNVFFEGDFKGREAANLSYEIRPADSKIKMNKIHAISIEVHNSGNKTADTVVITGTYDKSYFEGEEISDSFSLKADEYHTYDFGLFPVKGGATEINFNISAEKYNEDEKVKIEVIDNE